MTLRGIPNFIAPVFNIAILADVTRTRSQAVARIADRILPHSRLSVDCCYI